MSFLWFRIYVVHLIFLVVICVFSSSLFCDLALAQTQGTPLGVAGTGDSGSLKEDRLPSFPGGSEALSDYMKKNIVFPESAKGKNIQGMVMVTFDVAESGRIDSIRVLRSLDPDVDAAAVRMVQSMPLWEPGRQGGKAIKMPVTLPVRFQAFAQEAINTPAPAPARTVTTSPQTLADGETYVEPDVMPQFPGGMSALGRFISKNLNYPSVPRNQRIQGQVLLGFEIDIDGSITKLRVLRKIHPDLDAEALRVFKMLPKWTPGMKAGKPVKVGFTYPISFKIY